MNWADFPVFLLGVDGAIPVFLPVFISRKR